MTAQALAAAGVLGGGFAFLVLIVILFLILVSNIKIIPQAKAAIVERLGAYRSTWKTGVHFTIPFIDRIAKSMSLKEQVLDFPPQPVITSDNVHMQIDTVIYYQISDPKLYTYGVEHPMVAIENLTATTLRNIIGDLELDQTLTSRDIINTKMRAILDEATDPWGIKINRVELKNIMPPQDIQEAMEKQMRAERERREKILQAEGEKKSAVLIAEGQKESKILEAEGEAAAILKIQQAVADGIKLINEAAPSDKVIALKSLEALKELADGKANKLIIPSDIQGLATIASTLKLSADDKNGNK